MIATATALDATPIYTHLYLPMQCNEIDFNVRDVKRLMGLKYVMVVTIRLISYRGECGNFRDIETNVYSMVQWKERLEVP